MGALGPIDTLPLDHKSGSPESQSGLLPDINKPLVANCAWITSIGRPERSTRGENNEASEPRENLLLP